MLDNGSIVAYEKQVKSPMSQGGVRSLYSDLSSGIDVIKYRFLSWGIIYQILFGRTSIQSLLRYEEILESLGSQDLVRSDNYLLLDIGRLLRDTRKLRMQLNGKNKD